MQPITGIEKRDLPSYHISNRFHFVLLLSPFDTPNRCQYQENWGHMSDLLTAYSNNKLRYAICTLLCNHKSSCGMCWLLIEKKTFSTWYTLIYEIDVLNNNVISSGSGYWTHHHKLMKRCTCLVLLLYLNTINDFKKKYRISNFAWRLIQYLYAVKIYMVIYSIPQEICTRFLLCCTLLWLYIDWFSHIHQAYFTGTVAI